MKLFNIIAILISLSAILSYINHRYVRLPNAIGLMLIAMLMSLGLIILGPLGFDIKQDALLLLNSIDFDETLLHGMLSFLLFAGALHINLGDLYRQKWIISILASGGVIVSTFLVGISSWYIFELFGISIPFIYCLLFGSLISPTDPVAVLSILKKAGVSKTLETKIAGESLFNDGVAVVVFIVILKIAIGSHDISAGYIALLFIKEAIGGTVFGFAIGWITYQLLKSIDNYQVEILITLALVTGGFAAADSMHLSGPIAIVVAGLLIGNHGRMFAMSDKTREHLDMFWELVDEIMNTVLFVLIGLEILILTFTKSYFYTGLILIPVLLLSRLISVSIPVTLLKPFRKFSPHVTKILTWGGLRGGISIALALSLPPGPYRDIIIAVTYLIVIFSIAVQGLSIGGFVRILSKMKEPGTDD
ncbi:MAG: sodium:proton antiporter [Desulfobacterales bacterium]|nr:sodium:proton antiporter [Desulfobacterales bacterium]